MLERNVSAGVALNHKRAVNLGVQLLTSSLSERLPELSDEAIYHVVASTFLTTAGAWPHARPSEAVLAAYAADPGIGATSTDFVPFIRQSLAVTIIGLLTKAAAGRA